MIVIGVDVHKHSLTAVAVDKSNQGRYRAWLRSSRRGLGRVGYAVG
jgi:hypothetical protein